jgi:hypothetical protein
MNETQLIRAQLATEQSHLGAVAQACAAALRKGRTSTPPGGAALAPFQQACVEYLQCVLGWYEARDQRLARLAAGLGGDDPRCRTVNEILARSGASREALHMLSSASTSPATGWENFVQFLSGPWSARRAALEQLLSNDSRAVDWRRIGGIDADGILEERARFARVAGLLPAGVTLAPPTLRPE